MAQEINWLTWEEAIEVSKAEKKKFLDFAKKSKVNILYEKDFKFKSYNNIEDQEFNSYREKLKNTLFKFMEIFKIEFDLRIFNKYFDSIKVFKAKEIILTVEKQRFSHGICYYEIIDFMGRNRNEILEIYYLEDEIYKNFRHPTIVFYLSEFISDYLGLKIYERYIQTILSIIDNDIAVDSFLSKLG